MTTGTHPQGPHRPSSGGRGAALLIGAVAFALVFLLIVGATVGYLVFRDSSGSSQAATTTESSATQEDPPPEEPSGTLEPPEDVEPEKCYLPEQERTSTNPSGKLRGGGLEFIPPSIYDSRMGMGNLGFMNDIQSAQANVEGTWYSVMIVAAVEWQPGIDYPGAEAASKSIADCVFANTNWGDQTSGRSWDDETTRPVTVAGMPGYETTATVNFERTTLETTDATLIRVVVVDTPEGPSAFIAETARGVTTHEEAVEEAYSSLTGLSS